MAIKYVDFDPDLAAIGAIEPRFVSDSVLKWRDALNELADEIPHAEFTLANGLRVRTADGHTYGYLVDDEWVTEPELVFEIPQPGRPTMNLLESHSARALPLRRELR